MMYRRTSAVDSAKFTYALGRVRVLQSRLLTASAYERLLEAPNLSAQKRVLSDTLYGGLLDEAVTVEQVEGALERAVDDVFADLLDPASSSGVTVEFFNEWRLLTVKMPASSDSHQGSYLRLAGSARRSGSALLVDVASMEIDHANIRMVLRAHRRGLDKATVESMVVAGGTLSPAVLMTCFTAKEPVAALVESGISGLGPEHTGLLSDMETMDLVFEQRRSSRLATAAMVAAGSDPVIAYLFRRLLEIMRIRLIVVATMGGADEMALRRRLGQVV